MPASDCDRSKRAADRRDGLPLAYIGLGESGQPPELAAFALEPTAPTGLTAAPGDFAAPPSLGGVHADPHPECRSLSDSRFVQRQQLGDVVAHAPERATQMYEHTERGDVLQQHFVSAMALMVQCTSGFAAQLVRRILRAQGDPRNEMTPGDQ